MKATVENVKQLEDGQMYWVLCFGTWSIGRFVEKYLQFQLLGRTVCDIPNTDEIDPEPIKRKT